MSAKTMKQYYDDAYYGMLEKIQEAVWDMTSENGSGPWSEGQFDAAEEVGEFIQSKIRLKIMADEATQKPKS